MLSRIALCLLVCSLPHIQSVELITEPRPGEEYVLVSSGGQQPVRNFETSHKVPEKHPQHHVHRNDDDEKIIKKLSSKSSIKHPAEGIISIEDKRGLLRKGQKNSVPEAIEVDIPVSKLEDIKIKENIKNVDTNPKLAVALEAMSESGKLSASSGTTTQKPILTTAPTTTTKAYDYIPVNFDSIDDINDGLLSSNLNLDTAGSEQKQHSRIQIKKGPNGQEYEYEYIYYYYDDEEGTQKTKDKSTLAPIHNAHDGPQKVENENQINKESKTKNKYSTIDRTGSTTPASATVSSESQNEILLSTRGRQRGRNISPAPVQEEIIEERLPASTRFPPRSRNLVNTTPTLPQTSPEILKQRSKSQMDSVADESIGQTRSRTRAHIRRPSSELVDLDSFKTGDSPSQYKEIPSKYSEEETEQPITPKVPEQSHAKENVREGHSLSSSVRFQEILDDSKLPVDYKPTTSSYDRETTEYTTMTAMEKVALDLYAYLAGENLNNDINPTGDDLLSFDGSTTVEEDDWTTEALSTTEEATTTTSTTTTTTTTTTSAPTTTTTTTTSAPSTRASRFKQRNGVRVRTSSTTTTEATQEAFTKGRVGGRFNRPTFGGRRTTTAPVETSAVEEKVEEKVEHSAVQSKAPGRSRFGNRSRLTKLTTTASPATESGNTTTKTEHVPTRTRLRPSFNIRRPGVTTSTTTALSEDSNTATTEAASETPLTSTRTLGRARLPGVRPLRPGPRLTLGRVSSTTTTTEIASEIPAETATSEAASHSEGESNDDQTETTPTSSLKKLRNRNRLTVSATPKPRVSTAAPTRRPNPLLKRRLQTAEPKEPVTETSEATATEILENDTSVENKAETEAEEVVTEAPAPPRGLNALLARRRLAAGRPVTRSV